METSQIKVSSRCTGSGQSASAAQRLLLSSRPSAMLTVCGSTQESGVPVPQRPARAHRQADHSQTAADGTAAAGRVAGPGLTGFQMKTQWRTISACLVLHVNFYLGSLSIKRVKIAEAMY